MASGACAESPREPVSEGNITSGAPGSEDTNGVTRRETLNSPAASRSIAQEAAQKRPHGEQVALDDVSTGEAEDLLARLPVAATGILSEKAIQQLMAELGPVPMRNLPVKTDNYLPSWAAQHYDSHPLDYSYEGEDPLDVVGRGATTAPVSGGNNPRYPYYTRTPALEADGRTRTTRVDSVYYEEDDYTNEEEEAAPESDTLVSLRNIDDTLAVLDETLLCVRDDIRNKTNDLGDRIEAIESLYTLHCDEVHELRQELAVVHRTVDEISRLLTGISRSMGLG
jgi:hypothetical protein